MTEITEQERKTWCDLVRDYLPGVSDEEADYILWNETRFPVGSLDDVKKDLERLRLRSAATDLLKACEEALNDFYDTYPEEADLGDDARLSVRLLREAIAKATGEVR